MREFKFKPSDFNCNCGGATPCEEISAEMANKKIERMTETKEEKYFIEKSSIDILRKYYTDAKDPLPNFYKDIPNCDFCNYSAGVYHQITGDNQGKNICAWCLEKKQNKNKK